MASDSIKHLMDSEKILMETEKLWMVSVMCIFDPVIVLLVNYYAGLFAWLLNRVTGLYS